MKKCETIEAKIYCGLKSNSNSLKGYEYSPKIAKTICQEYVDEVGLCVSLTETTFIYTEGEEPGIIVGLINYPRFPSDLKSIKHHCLKLGDKLLGVLDQKRLSIVLPNETIMLINPKYKEE